MKSWLRIILITMTVGGGFMGTAVTLQAIFSSSTDPRRDSHLHCVCHAQPIRPNFWPYFYSK
jgi:hypothetical protein